MQSTDKTDFRWLKLYVFVDWVLNTLHQAFLLKAVYIYLVKDIGDVLGLAFFQRYISALLQLKALPNVLSSLVPSRIRRSPLSLSYSSSSFYLFSVLICVSKYLQSNNEFG